MALPRRANTIRQLAAAFAHERLTQVTARQTVSDRIGYLCAVLLGAGVVTLAGWVGVAIVGALYGVSVHRAYRRWKATGA